MATYNGGQFLAEQLESLATQRLLPAELQVGDDGSTDDTLEILERFSRTAPFPVAIYRNAANLGFGENFLQTAARCSGEWVAFCDQDDIWAREKIQRCAEVIASAGEELMLVVHGAVLLWGPSGEVEVMDDLPLVGLHSRLHLPPDWMAPGFRQVFRRSLVEQVPFSDRYLPWRRGYEEAHDAWIPLLANATGSILLLDDPLVKYRRHEANTTALPRTRRQRAPDRLRAILQNNGAAYSRQSKMAVQIADVFQNLSALVQSRTTAEHMRDAADAVRRYSRDLGTRATIYEAPHLTDRLKSLWQLARSERYWRPPWSFGPRALLKDIASTLLTAADRRRPLEEDG